MKDRYPRVASLRTPAALREHLATLGVQLPCDDEIQPAPESALAAALPLGDGPDGALVAPNRFVIQPMEGWDATTEGRPGPLTIRRWQNFGRSGAGWIWGGEAVAVQSEGRANPNQLVMNEDTVESLAGLRVALLDSAREAGQPEPVVGLQLTHSGRWSRPDGPQLPRVAYRHPLLDRRVNADDASVLSDGDHTMSVPEPVPRTTRTTSWSSCWRWGTSAEPMRPVDPVTAMRMGRSYV